MTVNINTFVNFKLINNKVLWFFSLPWAVCHLAVASTAEGFIELLFTGLHRLNGLTKVVILFTTCFWCVEGSFRFSSSIPENVDNWRTIQVTKLRKAHFHTNFFRFATSQNDLERQALEIPHSHGFSPGGLLPYLRNRKQVPCFYRVLV